MSLFRKYTIICLLITGLLSLGTIEGLAQVNILLDTRYDSLLETRRQKAMDMYNRIDTVSASTIWPAINPKLFFRNVRNNILYPAKINQGSNTNFCGYAAMTHLLLKYHPEIYLSHIISLYRTGSAKLEKKTLKPTEGVRKAAGSLTNKGELDVLHADQLWFLTLADQFKGYLNWTNTKYNPGDENKMWASTNYAKFNRMLQHFTREKTHSVGSDLIRPWVSFYSYITEQLDKGIVVLYVNGKYLNTHKFTMFKLRAPTHFIVLYKMYKVGDNIEIQYWDYGLRTQQLITSKRLKKLIFGVTTISLN